MRVEGPGGLRELRLDDGFGFLELEFDFGPVEIMQLGMVHRMATEGNASSVELAHFVPVQVFFVLQARTFSINVGRWEEYRGGEAIPLQNRKGVSVEITVTIVKSQNDVAGRKIGRLEWWIGGMVEGRIR